MLNYKIINHFNIYCFGLVLLVVSLPFSVYMMSVSQFILAINWLLEGRFIKKFQILKERKSILLLICVYIVHVLGLLYTSNYDYAFHDLRIKAPLFILPLIIGTSQPLCFKHFKILILFLVAAVTVNSFISILVLMGYTNYEIHEVRNISIFISHIRYSLLINIAIFSLAYFIAKKGIIKYKAEKYFYLICGIWLIVFLFILQSLTGIAVFFITSFLILGYLVIRYRNIKYKIAVYTLWLLLPLSVFLYLRRSYCDFYDIKEENPEKLEKYTSQGNLYYHDYQNKHIENGNYIWLYLCEKELREEWNKISEYKYDGKDKMGQDIKNVLIRYLTSKGLRKDADGMAQLNNEDVKAIEDGIANHLFRKRMSLYQRIYKIIWQIDVYFKGGNPKGHSITQRLEYLKTSMQIIKDNIWIGVGTGDVQASFNEYYEKMGSQLTGKWRRRAHNQFITFTITFGVAGVLLILFFLFYPIILEKQRKDYFLWVFLVIALLSMINEDTLETQAGVTFFTFFYSLLLLGRARE